MGATIWFSSTGQVVVECVRDPLTHHKAGKSSLGFKLILLAFLAGEYIKNVYVEAYSNVKKGEIRQ